MQLDNTVEKMESIVPFQGAKKIGRFRRMVPAGVSRKLGRTLLVAQKHSPTILFVGGVAGMVATTVLACRATLKVESVLDEHLSKMKDAKELSGLNDPDYTEPDFRKDMTYLYIRSAYALCKLYGPTVVLGIASIGALAGSRNILNRRNAALTAAYAAIEKGFADYRARVVQQYGEEKDLELRYDARDKTLVEDTDKGVKKINVKVPGDGAQSMYARLFAKETSRNWQKQMEYNRFFISSQQTFANDLLRARGHVFLNEVHDMLGLERTQAGQAVGWLLDGEGNGYIDFGVFKNNVFMGQQFVNGNTPGIWLDFNVDGTIHDKI
jgi:hypothetical protein